MQPLNPNLKLHRDGAELTGRALDGCALASLDEALKDQPRDVAGVRLFGVERLRPFLDPAGPIGSLAAGRLGESARPVRAILFDKTPSANWSLAWHQDRVIAVRERVDVEGFRPWTRKHGALHVAPPFEILAGMLTIRIHLDATPETNAPLLIAPGSHLLGKIPRGRSCWRGRQMRRRSLPGGGWRYLDLCNANPARIRKGGVRDTPPSAPGRLRRR